MAQRKEQERAVITLLLVNPNYQPEPKQDFYEQDYDYEFSRDEVSHLIQAENTLVQINDSLPFKRIGTSRAMKDLASRIRLVAVSIDGRLFAK